MHQISISRDDAKRLRLDADKMQKRVKAVNTRLRGPILELVSPVMESHVMMFGTEFKSGIEIADFVLDMSEYVISGLMEQGKLAKTLPAAKKGSTTEGEGHPGMYL